MHLTNSKKSITHLRDLSCHSSFYLKIADCIGSNALFLLLQQCNLINISINSTYTININKHYTLFIEIKCYIDGIGTPL